MTLFPYVMLRVAGLPYSIMERLRWDNAAVAAYLAAAQQLENERERILQDLEDLILQIEDYPAKYYLKILRSDIFSDRRIKVKSFTYSGKFTRDFEKIVGKVRNLSNKQDELQSKYASLGEGFRKEVLRSRSFLQSQSTDPILRKGLQLASHSVLQRLDRFRARSPEQFNKKYAQTERTLLQYLSRICTKTSPFCQFTQLSFWDLSDDLICATGSKVRLNNQLYQLLRDALTFYPPFYRRLRLRWNASAELVEDKWVYLLNTRNVESIQRMDHTAVLELLAELLKAQPQATFDDLCKALLEHIDADEDEISDYLLNLIHYGILEWQWPVSGLDPDWLEQMIDWLSKHKDELVVSMHQVLLKLQQFLQIFSIGEERERQAALDEAYQLVQAFKDRLFEKIDFSEQDLQNVSSLKTITLKQFGVPKEQLFYEDVSRKEPMDLSLEGLQQISEEVKLLLKGLQPYFYKAERYRHELFFAEHFTGQSVPVLKYYEAFYQSNPPLPSPPEEVIEQQKKLLDKTLDLGLWIAADHFHMPAEEWKNTSSLPDNDAPPSAAALLQVFREEGQSKAYLDMVTMGFGKLWGRFLHLFPDSITTVIRERNSALTISDEHWAENIDASVYNPNIHPPLLHTEIQVPGGQQLRSPERQLRLSDLALRQRPASKKIELLHLPSERPVKIFDFGFEALENRSPLYRLLALFAYRQTNPGLLINLLDQRIVKTIEQDIKHFPRISFGKHLILRRRGWGIPAGALPLKQKGEDDFAYFLRIQNWRKTLDLPERVFVTIQESASGVAERRQRGDHYKPQYIDFTSPAFVQLFSRLLPKVKTQLKIEEMLPEAKGEQYVKEMVMEVQGSQGSQES